MEDLVNTVCENKTTKVKCQGKLKAYWKHTGQAYYMEHPDGEVRAVRVSPTTKAIPYLAKVANYVLVYHHIQTIWTNMYVLLSVLKVVLFSSDIMNLVW